ncbi:hypothetical protein [Flavilitoribacter nigricans]|uniref:Uncharacterized protein n=1 Tax=Flavilitoribacter nigricans (strain ATCC 23147 / DSM 23189 / NBRC 102662 / NCIMB 1420 / SS-2) TaxID=1122177 RepID=A0A2D0NCR8_FLAN2|nr:hypothetical protein [Flavilitoribacter nigricans]PHN05563.1 hypothetical protein CRP01_16360 [Flavilitoribacter nigricans DSM 23189 = NBRC 102662]
MAGIWDYIKNIFKEAEESSPSNPAIHAMIERSEEERAAFQQWQDSLVKRRLVDWLDNQYAIYRVTPHDIDEAMDFLDTPSSKGFVIHFYKTNYNRQEVTHFFDFLKEQIKGLNYKVQISDTRTYNRKDWVETVERHYLKPRPQFEKGVKIDQRFGNITIELVLRNDRVYQLKLQATSYRDHLYEEAEEFRDLMQAILR